MLKIKDNVDLKELEKYGFKLDKEGNYVSLVNYEGSWYYEKGKKLTHKVEQKIKIFSDKEIDYVVNSINNISETCKGFGFNIETLDLLYDLIKADLVEKVQ